MKINEDAVKAIKTKYEFVNDRIYHKAISEAIENEIMMISEICDNLSIEVSDEEITFIRYIVTLGMRDGYNLASNTLTPHTLMGRV